MRVSANHKPRRLEPAEWSRVRARRVFALYRRCRRLPPADRMGAVRGSWNLLAG